MREISLKINGKKFNFFTKFDIELKYNSIASTFSFDGNYDPASEGHKSLFKPLSFNRTQLYYESELFLTGIITGTSTSGSAVSSLANLAGYSLPGVLEDCPIPVDLYPLQFDQLNLIEITNKLVGKFGLSLIVDSAIRSEASKVYEKIAAEPGKSIKEFLSELAGQRNIVLTHDTSGRVVMTRANVSQRSVATYDENVPSTNIALTVNGQAIHSKLTAMKQATIGTDVEGESTVSNSLISIYRPGIALQDSGNNDATESFAKKSRGSELRAIDLTIETDRWQWYDGKRLRLIQPNSIIDVISPSNYINRRTRFFVESVSFEGTTGINRAILKCVLPECYTGENPRNIFA